MTSVQTQHQSPPETDPDIEETSIDTTPDPPQSVPLDVVFGILKNERRRLVLQYMAETDDQTSLSDLAEHIASIENDKAAHELDSQERKRVYVGLYQCHLPRMHDSGAIDFDKNRGTVKPGANIDQFYEYLDQPEPDQTPWSRDYLGHAGVSTVLVVSALFLFEAIVTVLFAASLAGFALLSVFHATHSPR